MGKLIFEIKGDERKWDVLLNDFMGEELTKECSLEYIATAADHSARVLFLNYKSNKALMGKLEKSENILSAYMVDNKKIVKVIK
ncbi:MAG: hypothetical protein B6I20_04210 [Bacteroidetes bacterium 4572_117]|nr:MAG: hypothetical protein B6I20_04210 [Bacteroidetes bacterium 4572_117]